MSMTADERLASISERLTRMEERQIADAARAADMRTAMEKANNRLDSIEHSRAWLTGIAAALAAVAGWFAKAFTITTTGGK
jgi:hypothetical protein